MAQNFVTQDNYSTRRVRPGITMLGMVLSLRGDVEQAGSMYDGALAGFQDRGTLHLKGFVHACLAQQALWLGNHVAAEQSALTARQYFDQQPTQLNTITSDRLLGTIALAKGDLDDADQTLHRALAVAQANSRVEEALLIRPLLAELYRCRRKLSEARKLPNDMDEPDLRESYPWIYATGANVWTSIERDAGDKAKAAEAALESFKLAWLDGPPFSYRWGLEIAQRQLEEFDVPLLELPPFDADKYLALSEERSNSP